MKKPAAGMKMSAAEQGVEPAPPITSDTSDSETGDLEWEFEFAVAGENLKELPPVPAGNPNTHVNRVLRERRQSYIDQLTQLQNWAPLVRNARLGRRCAKAYMLAVANGKFDVGLTGSYYEFTEGPVRFPTSTHGYMFAGDSCAPDAWVPERQQWAVFRDRTRDPRSKEPLIIVRNRINAGEERPSGSVVITETDDDTPSAEAANEEMRRRRSLSGIFEDCDAAGPVLLRL